MEQLEIIKPPFDEDEHMTRKYHMLAGGRIEFQTKGKGSTARLLANGHRMPTATLSCDGIMGDMAAHMHTAIEAYAKEKQATAETLAEEATNLYGKQLTKNGELRDALEAIMHEAGNSEPSDAMNIIYSLAKKALNNGGK